MPKVQLLYPEKALEDAAIYDISLIVIKDGQRQVLLDKESYQAVLEGEEIELNGYPFDLGGVTGFLAIEVQSFHGGLDLFFNSIWKAFIAQGDKAHLLLPEPNNVTELEYLSLYGDTPWEEIAEYTTLKGLAMTPNRSFLDLLLLSKLKDMDLLLLSKLKNLKWLSLQDYHSISNMESLANLTNLTYIDLSGCKSITDLTPLANLTNLIYIDLSSCKSITDLTPFTSLTNLTQLNLSWCGSIEDLTPLSNLTNLTHIDINSCESISDLTPLSNLTKLTEIDLSYCKSLTDLTPLSDLTNLSEIDLKGCRSLTDLTPLSNLTNLTEINLSGCENITSLTPLANLSNLTSLDISCQEKLTSIRFVLSLPQLQSFCCEGCPNIHDFEDLEQLPNLRELTWGRTGDVHYVLMGSACRRADAAFIEEQLEDWVGTVHMAQDKMKYGLRLLETCTVPGVNAGAYLPDIGQALREAARIPGQVPGAFWSRYVETALAYAAESLPACLDAVVSELDYDRELQEILYPLLLQLAETEPVPDWLREWVVYILEPAATRPECARAIAPAAAVCWAGFGDAGRLRFWEEKGTDPEQRDRVAAALACFYAKKGRFDKAKEYLDRISSRAVRDRTSAYIATQRAGSNMGAALDLLFEVQDESMRFDTAKELSRYPEATQNPQHAFRLLLVLEQQAEALADFLEQWAEPTPAPEGEASTQPVPLAPTPGLSDRDFFLIASSPWLCQAIGPAKLERLRDEHLPKTAAARSELYQSLAKMLVHNGLLESEEERYFVKTLIATTKDE